MNSAVKTASVAVFASLVLAGCAGRDANPVPIVQPFDPNLSCGQLHAEYAGNELKVRGLIGEQQSSSNANVAIGVVGAILFWPALFALDVGDAEKTEMQAYHSRNQYLASLMVNKGCANAPPVGAEQKRARSVEDAEKAGIPPECKDVGGYEEYMAETGEVCRVAGAGIPFVPRNRAKTAAGQAAAPPAAVPSSTPRENPVAATPKAPVPKAPAPKAAEPTPAPKEEIIAARPVTPVTDAAPAASPPPEIASTNPPEDIANAAPAYDPSTPDGLKSLLADRVLYAKHVEAEYREGWTFGKNGGLKGSYYEDDVYAPKEDEDIGKWWIAGNKVCMQWSRWRDGRESCATVELDGVRLRAYDSARQLVWSGEFL